MQLFLDLIVNFLQCLVFPAFHQYRMEYLAQRIAQAPQAFSELMAVFVFALQQPEPAAHQAYPLNQAELEFEFFFERYKALGLQLVLIQPYIHLPTYL